MSESNIKILCDKSLIDNIGNAIRSKTGSEEKLTIEQLAIGAGLHGDPKLQDKTIDPITSVQSIKADSGYDGLGTVIVNAIPTTTQATPDITVDSSGLIIATATQTDGYVAAGTKTATKQLAFQAAKTITPGTIDQVAVAANYFTGGAVTVKGDGNLIGENIVKGKSIFGVNGTHECSGGGSTDIEDAIVSRTITEYTNDRVKNIGNYTFQNCFSLTAVNFPVCTNISGFAFNTCSGLVTISFPVCITIGSNAFNRCSSLIEANFPVCITIGSSAFNSCYSLTTADFPKCTIINDYAFNACSNLTTVDFPVCTSIGSYAFNACSNLTTVDFPKCTKIGNNAFQYCIGLTTISFPVCTSIGNNAFQYCDSLTTVDFPACKNIGNSAFGYCSLLTTVNFPVCTSIGSSAFYYCSRLTTVDFPVCTSIGSYAFVSCISLTAINFPACTDIGLSAFNKCYKLLSLTLGASKVCTLRNSNAFTSTPIAGYTSSTNGVLGSIFVPASLVSAYKTATNWTYFADRIAAIPA